MNLQRNRIGLLSSITILSIIALIYIQWNWLQTGAVLNKDLYDKKMGLLLHEIKEYLQPSMQDIDQFAGTVNGQKLLFDESSSLSNAEEIVLQGVDKIFKHNGLPNNYTIRGKATDGRCIFHSKTPGPYHEAWLVQARNQVCLCHYIHQGTFDFILEVDEQIFAFKQKSNLLIPSLLFLFILLATLFYTIYILSKQKKLSELKTDFINNLTHEFKTPIFTIGLSSNMLAKSDVIQEDEKLKSYVELIGRENQRLKNQVDKVLQMAVIDSGNLALEKKVFKLDELVQKVADSFRMAIEERGGTLELDLNAKQTSIYADETHVSNTIYNLVDNAYKYSKAIPKIKISTYTEADYLILEVSDKGIGMTVDQQKKIFDQFYRVQRSNRHDVKGFGLGLSYVKNMVELHQGTIKVNSIKGKGTQFIIQLPI